MVVSAGDLHAAGQMTAKNRKRCPRVRGLGGPGRDGADLSAVGCTLKGISPKHR